jgi:hypothetical protein
VNTLSSLLNLLQTFATAVAAKLAKHTQGEPEEQLRQPFENFMQQAGGQLTHDVVCTGVVHTSEGRPDFAVNVSKLLTGYSELKAPGKVISE